MGVQRSLQQSCIHHNVNKISIFDISKNIFEQDNCCYILHIIFSKMFLGLFFVWLLWTYSIQEKWHACTYGFHGNCFYFMFSVSHIYMISLTSHIFVCQLCISCHCLSSATDWEKTSLILPIQISWPWPPVSSLSHGLITVRQKKIWT